MTEILDAQQLAERLQISTEQVRKLTSEGRIPRLVMGPRLTRYNLDEVCDALRVASHPDDDAIDRFADRLRERMAQKREEGRGGWEQCDEHDLGLRLLRSIADGDPIDVGNYAMMIATLGAGTEHVLNTHLAKVLYEQHSPYALVKGGLVEAAKAALAAWLDENGAIKPAMDRLARELS